MNLKKILGLLTKEQKDKFLNIKDKSDVDFASLRSYLNDLDKIYSNKKKTLASVEKTIKFKSKSKVVAEIKVDDYDWVIYNGEVAKEIPYCGMNVIVNPESVCGIAKVENENKELTIVLPEFKSGIKVKKNYVIDLKNNSIPYEKDVINIFTDKKDDWIDEVTY